MHDGRVMPLVLENRHTGERLELCRERRDGDVCLAIRGSLPGRREGPPMHVHFLEDEEGVVISGTISAIVGGRTISAGAGTFVRFPRGVAHRWWNASEETLVVEGLARPLVDLDRYLQGAFDVLNAGPPGRPSLFYMAHLALRHEHTQSLVMLPRPLQAVLFRVVVGVGALLGKYRGRGWPGCPSKSLAIPERTSRPEGSLRI